MWHKLNKKQINLKAMHSNLKPKTVDAMKMTLSSCGFYVTVMPHINYSGLNCLTADLLDLWHLWQHIGCCGFFLTWHYLDFSLLTCFHHLWTAVKSKWRNKWHCLKDEMIYLATCSTCMTNRTIEKYCLAVFIWMVQFKDFNHIWWYHINYSSSHWCSYTSLS